MLYSFKAKIIVRINCRLKSQRMVRLVSRRIIMRLKVHFSVFIELAANPKNWRFRISRLNPVQLFHLDANSHTSTVFSFWKRTCSNNWTSEGWTSKNIFLQKWVLWQNVFEWELMIFHQVNLFLPTSNSCSLTELCYTLTHRAVASETWEWICHIGRG